MKREGRLNEKNLSPWWEHPLHGKKRKQKGENRLQKKKNWEDRIQEKSAIAGGGGKSPRCGSGNRQPLEKR